MSSAINPIVASPNAAAAPAPGGAYTRPAIQPGAQTNPAAAAAAPATADAASSRYAITGDANVITATDSQTGDAIAYSRQTKSYLVHDGTSGINIYGYGNGAFEMQNPAQNVSLTVTQSGDSTLSENGQSIALGKITNPHVLAALTQLFGGKAVNDLSVAVAKKDLEKTSVGAAFPYSIVDKLASIQGQDNYTLVQQSLSAEQKQALAQQQNGAAQAPQAPPPLGQAGTDNATAPPTTGGDAAADGNAAAQTN